MPERQTCESISNYGPGTFKSLIGVQSSFRLISAFFRRCQVGGCGEVRYEYPDTAVPKGESDDQRRR